MSTDRDTTIRKYPKLRYPGEPESDGWNDGPTELKFLEKMDGSNMRFKYYPYSEDKQLLFGSRNVLFHQNGEPQYEENVNKMFLPTIQYVRNNVDTAVLRHLEEDQGLGELWFYGESVFRHSIDYQFDGKYPDPEDGDTMPNFLGFDVWQVDENRWLPHDVMVSSFHAIGLETVPVSRRVQTTDLGPEHEEIPVSEYRTPDPRADTEFNQKGLAEGVVIRNDMTEVRAKLVHDEFQEKNAIDFESPGKAKTEAGKFIATYVTKARIRKQAHKLIEEGGYDELEMEMMEDLPEQVFRDIMEEHGWEIFCSDIDLDTDVRGQIRSRGASKCARTLQDMIQGF